MTTSKIIKVFLASPGDVSPERERAEEVVVHLNKDFRQAGIAIELLMWEEQPPGVGRPQGQINPMVDECDIFVGLLWQRWGTPTGSFSSGFEEEFHRATERRKGKTKPEIWLAFKEVPRTSAKDPGDQLKRVLDFRNKQEELNEILFHKFKNIRQWEQKLRSWLTRYVLPIAKDLASQPEKPSTSLLVTKDFDSTATDYLSDSGTSAQIIGLLPKFTSAVESGFAEFDANPANHLQELDIVRLYLLTSTLMSRRYTREIVGVREMNLIHRHRSQIDPTPIEMSELRRSLVGQGGDAVPGWYWMRHMTEEETISWLLNLAKDDFSESVRLNALKLLSGAKTTISSQLWNTLPLNDSDWMVRNAAYDYLAQIGDESALPLFESPEEVNALSTSAYAKIKLLSRISPEKAVSDFLTEESYFPDDVVKSVREALALVNDKTLETALESPNDQIREGALMELASRGALSPTSARKFLEDPKRSVRANAILGLIKYGEMPPIEEVKNLLKAEGEDAKPSLYRSLSSPSSLSGNNSLEPEKIDSVLLAYFRTKNSKELQSLVDWFSIDGRLAYKALALDHFDEFAEQIRSDLQTDFERVKQEAEDRLVREHIVESRQHLVDSFRDLETFMRSGFTEAALAGILENGDPSDIHLIRKYLADESFQVRRVVAALLCKYGNADDVPHLVELAKSDWEPWRGTAARAALKFSSDPEHLAFEMLVSKTSEVSIAAFDWFLAFGSDEDLFRQLLHVKEENMRARAVFYLQSRVQSTNTLAQILEQCQDSGYYYYDVVTWLDRFLYAPLPFRELFLSDLKKQLH